LVIIGIITTLAVPQYQQMVEKFRGVEVYPIFNQFRKEFLARKATGLAITAPEFNPNVGEDSNPSWELLGMKNPNASATANFCYDYWSSNSNTTAWWFIQWAAGRNVIVSRRRTVKRPYSNDLDMNTYIIMDLDTGEIYKSEPY